MTAHTKFDKHEIDVVQKATDLFELNGRRFLNADYPSLTFKATT